MLSPAARAPGFHRCREHLLQCSCRVLYSIKPHRFPLCLHQDFGRRECDRKVLLDPSSGLRRDVGVETPAPVISACTHRRYDCNTAQAVGLSRPRVARPAGLLRACPQGELQEDDMVAGDRVSAHMKPRRGSPATTARQAHRARVGDAWGIYTDSFLRVLFIPLGPRSRRCRAPCAQSGRVPIVPSETRRDPGLATGPIWHTYPEDTHCPN